VNDVIQLNSSESISIAHHVESWNAPVHSTTPYVYSETHPSTLIQSNITIDGKRRALLTKAQIEPKSPRTSHPDMYSSGGDSPALLRMKAAAAAAAAAKARAENCSDFSPRLHIANTTLRAEDPTATQFFASSPRHCQQRGFNQASAEFQAVDAI
jgi:hypothetical protein